MVPLGFIRSTAFYKSLARRAERERSGDPTTALTNLPLKKKPRRCDPSERFLRC